MAVRQQPIQGLHDRVIDFIKSHLSVEKYEIYTNPGSEQNWSIKGEFPDILLTSKESKQIQFVIEIETADSITPEEARNQWKAYSGLPGVFHILVPRDSMPIARQIIAGQGIQTKLGYYVVGHNGEITNVQYNAE